MSVRKLSWMLFLVNGLQFLLGAGLLLGLQWDLLEYSERLIDLSVALVLLSSLLSIIGLFSVTRYRNRSYEESMKNLENLNLKLREQRHDYLNQIQIVHGLLELGEYEEARDYLQPVFKDIVKVSRALRTAQPAVNALLQAKLEEAERQGIDFYLEVGTQLLELAAEPWELCKILANLIDNAITAVADQEGERRILLRLAETEQRYYFLVQNNGPEISKAQQKLIFNRGYTTKSGEGHGIGLAIVAAALKETGGGIEVSSGPGATSFTFFLPRKGCQFKGEKRQVGSKTV